MKNKKFENLERKLNIATELVNEMTIDVESIELVPVEVVNGEVATQEDKPVELFTMDTLKTDFMLIRNNIMKLVADGQRILSTASVIDVSDLKASTIQALAGLQQAIGQNLKLMVDSYKIIVEIEKLRQKESKFSQVPQGAGSVNMGVVNNIVFSGSTNDLLSIIHDNK